jgi:acyl-coenzyme A thioesterase 13
MTFLGGDVELLEAGHVVMSVKLQDRHMNPGGRLHGAIIAALIDEAAGRAVATARGIDLRHEPHATIEMNVSFLSGAGPGDEITCEATALRVGRNFSFAEAELRRRSDAKLIAKGRATFAVAMSRPADSPAK